MNSHMKSWLKSVIWINPDSATNQFYAVVKRLVSVWEIIHSSKTNYDPSLKAAYCQPWGCCFWCYGRRLLLRTAGPGDAGAFQLQSFKHIIDVTGVETLLVCLSAMKETAEMFKLRYHHQNQPWTHFQGEALRTLEGFEAGQGRK